MQSNWWIYFDNLNESVVTYHKRGWLTTYAHEILLISNCFLAAGLGTVLSQDAGEVRESEERKTRVGARSEATSSDA